MLLIAGLFVAAAILGLIIAVMEGEFPGWGTTIICVLAALIPSAIINALLPGYFDIPGNIVGSICAGFAISALTGMTVKRATIAAAIYFAVTIAIGFALGMMFGGGSVRH
jgi:hypothetical protein